MNKHRRQFLMHDQLPFEDDSNGLTVAEIVRLMTAAGCACNKDTVARDLRDLDRYVYLEPVRRGGKIFWRRLYETRLTEALANPPSIPHLAPNP